MLFFGTKYWFFMVIDINSCKNWKSKEKKNNICCRKTIILLKTSNIDVLLLHIPFITSRSSKKLSDALITFSTHFLNGFLGSLLKKIRKCFFSKIPRNAFKTWIENVSKASDRFLDDRDDINDVCSNKTSLLLAVDKITQKFL